MGHLAEHAREDRSLLQLVRLADPAQAECAQRAPVVRVLPDTALDLGHFHRAHVVSSTSVVASTVSGAGAASGSGSEASGSGTGAAASGSGSTGVSVGARHGSTSAIVLPRIFATS